MSEIKKAVENPWREETINQIHMNWYCYEICYSATSNLWNLSNSHVYNITIIYRAHENTTNPYLKTNKKEEKSEIKRSKQTCAVNKGF